MRSMGRDFLIAIVTVFSSQFYMNYTIANFRFSLSAVLLPVLIVSLRRSRHAWVTGIVTGMTVVAFRMLLAALTATPFETSFHQNLPAGAFYVVYGFIFTCFSANFTANWPQWIGAAMFCSDLFSNALELTIRMRASETNLIEPYFALLGIALVRTTIGLACFYLVRRYQLLLRTEEHEHRYQRLFLLITGLKTEVYFMQKNSEEIEAVMKNAYMLYENLSDNPEQQKLALAIARDVHEVKKDYIRIIRGIELALSEQEQQEQMQLRDVFMLLEGYIQQQIDDRQLGIDLDLYCTEDFVTNKHWAVMLVLKNLVTNALEAMESSEMTGYIRVSAQCKGENCVLTVEDSGPGIPEKHMARIFSMGFSTKFEEKTGNIYRGVGLPGVKMTVSDILGGTISVQTRQGQYTRFIITVPLDNLMEQEEDTRS